MATPTTLYANWTGVQYTPSGGTAVPITHVSGCNFDPGGELTPYKGDANRFPIAQFNFTSNPTATCDTENVGTVASLVIGTVGTFVAILNDPKNGTGVGSGALSFTLNNAVIRNLPMGGRHAQYASGQIIMASYSTDGTTPPLGVVVQ